MAQSNVAGCAIDRRLGVTWRKGVIVATCSRGESRKGVLKRHLVTTKREMGEAAKSRRKWGIV